MITNSVNSVRHRACFGQAADVLPGQVGRTLHLLAFLADQRFGVLHTHLVVGRRRRLRPVELCRLLNSSPLGEVITERQLRRHRTRAGRRLGDDRHVDLVRYVAWLVRMRHAPKPETPASVPAGADLGEAPGARPPAPRSPRKATAKSSRASRKP